MSRANSIRLSLFVLLAGTNLGCPVEIGNRCGPELPPCPSGHECVSGTCTITSSTAGGSAGGASAGGASAGGTPAAGGTTTVGGGSAGGGTSADGGLAPVFTLNRPAPGEVVGGSMAELSGTVTTSRGREVTSATLTVNNRQYPLTLTPGAWSVTIPLVQGIEEMRPYLISAGDASGQTSTQTVSIEIDTLGPRAQVEVRTSDPVGEMATLRGTIRDRSPVGSLTVVAESRRHNATIDGGSWAAAVNFSPDLNREQSTLTVESVDQVGNMATTMATVLVDSRGPYLTLREPDGGAFGSPATLAGTATDPSGPVSNFSIDVGSGPLAVSAADGGWSVTVTFPPNLNRVTRMATLRGTDPLGNTTQRVVSFVVDTEGPALSVSWAPPPARATFADGADFRDPVEIAGGPAAFRRAEVVLMTVQSPSSDLNGGSVGVTVGGTRVDSSTGSNCSGDGGFCRTVAVPLNSQPLPSLRGNLGVEATGRDSLGNATTVDAGTLPVSRWHYAFDGGQPAGAFQVSAKGELVVAFSNQRTIRVLDSSGMSVATWTTQKQILGTAAVGQVLVGTSRRVYVFEESPGTTSLGEAFELSNPSNPSAVWAPADTREYPSVYGPVLRTNPSSNEEEVALVFRSPAQKSAAAWGSLVTNQFGTRMATPVFSIDAIGFVVARGNRVFATDGIRLFGFQGINGASGQMTYLEEFASPPTQSTGAFSAVSHLIGSREVMGVGRLAGGSYWGTFEATVPTNFNQAAASTMSLMSEPVSKAGTFYMSLLDGPPVIARLCKGTNAAPTLTCVNDAGGPTSLLALGDNNTLYNAVSRSNQLYLQVRSSLTLALQWEALIPDSVGALFIAPTCLNQVPVIGLNDEKGRIIFIQTDSKGIDTAAEWPMRAHDPGSTWNTSTPLDPFLCR